MPILSITEYRRFLTLDRQYADLQARVAALEARLCGETAPRQSGPLRARNSVRAAEGQRLRESIADILTHNRGSGELTAKHVLRTLEEADIDRLPSLRTVRWHMAALRGNGNAAAVLPIP